MNIVKKDDSQSVVTLKDGKLRGTTSPFQARVAQAQKNAQRSKEEVEALPHRICLMLDCSGSMESSDKTGQFTKIELLKQAVQNFAERCDFFTTAVAARSFPSGRELELTCDRQRISGLAFSLSAGGGTPMHQCVSYCVDIIPMTRGVIVSDGDATDWREVDYDDEVSRDPDAVLDKYKQLAIPIDCVHIGQSTNGEQLLRKIAERTGGLYIKFSDVSAFSVSFGYLAPAFRAMLTSGAVSAAELGAKEVK